MSAAVWRPRRSLHIFRALCRPGQGPAPSGAQRRLPPGGTLIGPLAALPNCKAPPYPRERRPGRVPHRRSGSRRARHARGQRDAGVPHAGGKPWAGPSGIRLAIPIGVPRGGGWLLSGCMRRSPPGHSTPAVLTHSCRPAEAQLAARYWSAKRGADLVYTLLCICTYIVLYVLVDLL